MMTFGEALEALSEGRAVRRTGWNGKGMFVFKTVGNTVPAEHISAFKSIPDGVKDFLQTRNTDVVFQPSLAMYTAAGEIQPGWLASQADMLSEDWEVAF